MFKTEGKIGKTRVFLTLIVSPLTPSLMAFPYSREEMLHQFRYYEVGCKEEGGDDNGGLGIDRQHRRESTPKRSLVVERDLEERH